MKRPVILSCLVLVGFLLAGSAARAQDFSGCVQQDPNAGTATYTFDFQGPPRGYAYIFPYTYPVFPTPSVPFFLPPDRFRLQIPLLPKPPFLIPMPPRLPFNFNLPFKPMSTGAFWDDDGYLFSDVCGGPVSSDSSVYLFNGEFHHEAIDLLIPGRGFDFVWSRKYRSRMSPVSALGEGWDFSYNMHLNAITQGPTEARDLVFSDAQNMNWVPPVDPAGDPAALRYCTLRSTDPSDFNNGATTSILDPEEPDTTTQDLAFPAPGELFSYLITPKNGTRPGDLGTGAGGPRQGLPCGVNAPDLVLHDGNARQDLYTLAGTVWIAPDFFREINQNPDTSFTVTFPDTGKWNFFPFDGSNQEGKISSIVDRNNNTMSFSYDPGGLLTTVTDTLGRPININYDTDGLIDFVTDFTGRQVEYDYYQDGDAGGSAGDLKSVTSPVVVGTPNGNDFPNGKTTVYTYSTGFADETLNHNLLTITDPKGQIYLINTYAPTINPADFNFDRIVSQAWGDPGDIIDYVYLPVAPGPANNFAVIRTIENDRVGNVTEYFYDDRNRNVLTREFTGRAPNPDGPTTDLVNRPGPQLRPGDPAFFESRWTYNPDSLVDVFDAPNQNQVVYVYSTTDPSRRSQGNPTDRCEQPGPLGGDQTQICELFEYDPVTNFVTRHTDGQGNDTFHTYDAAGNLQQTQHRIAAILENFEYNAFGQVTAHIWPDNGSGNRRRDEFSYFSGGPATGYLENTDVDALNLSLLYVDNRDAVGNLIGSTDPLGNNMTLDVNALNQVVRETSREVSPGGARYETDFFFDANDNVVRVDEQNVDDQGVLQPNAHLTLVTEYDILDMRIRSCDESGSFTGVVPGPTDLPTCIGLPGADFATTEFEYDENRNLTRVRLGEATNGTQPDNVVVHVYDERDLLFQTVRAPGTGDQSTTQYDYDGNRNVVTEHVGLESGPRVELRVYDGYDRLVSTTDPMGNELTFTYDANDRATDFLLEGEGIDVPGDTGNVRLSEIRFDWDDADRLLSEETEFFVADTQASIGGGLSVRSWVYSDNSQVIQFTDPNTNPRLFVYDTANRLSTDTDALGNEVTYTYDANSNVITRSSLEKSDIGSADETFVTTLVYDGLDRLIRETDHVGNFTTSAYDSRNNLTTVEDAQRPMPTDPGNVTRIIYDGLDRVVQYDYVLTDDGTGTGTVTGTLSTTRSWDDSSRLVGQGDGNGNLTSIVYDALNRPVSYTYQDGTGRSLVWDVHDNLTQATDANGTIVDFTYDLLNRNDGRTITKAAGVGGTASESYAYDGLSRLRDGQDDDSQVQRSYDSLGNVLSETLDGTTTTHQYDAAGNKTQSVYPGGRQVDCGYDALNRVKNINDPGFGPISVYDYIGGRVERRGNGNGTGANYVYDGLVNPPGDFGVKKAVEIIHDNPGGAFVIDHYTNLWDRMGNKTQRQDVRAGGSQLVHDYTYDSIYRVEQTSRAVFGGAAALTQYTLDDAGNRTNVTGGPHPGAYVLDATTPIPADLQANQYTNTAVDQRGYDDNGNLTVIDPGPNQRTFVYDYRNQMIDYQDPTGGVTAAYAYDVLGRRITRSVTGPPADFVDYYYDGHRVIEEQDNIGTTTRTFIYGRRGEVLNMGTAGAQIFPHADDLFNVTALTNGAGNVVERFLYEDYGEPQFFDSVFNPQPGSGAQYPLLWHGLRFDPETGFHFDGSRYLDPIAGRFTIRDSQGIWANPINLGNGFAFLGNNPESEYRIHLHQEPITLDTTGLFTPYSPPMGFFWFDLPLENEYRIHLHQEPITLDTTGLFTPYSPPMGFFWFDFPKEDEYKIHLHHGESGESGEIPVEVQPLELKSQEPFAYYGFESGAPVVQGAVGR